MSSGANKPLFTRMALAWQRLIEPHPALTDPDERRLARMLISMLAIEWLVVLCAIVLRGIGASSTTGSWIARGVLLIVLTIGFALAKTVHYRRANWWSILSTTALVLLLARVSKPSLALQILNYLGVILLSGSLLLSIRATLPVFALHMVALLTVSWWLPDATLGDSVQGPLLFNLTLYAFTMTVTYFRQALNAARRAQLQASEVRYRTVVELSPDGILLIEPRSKRVVEMNDVMRQLLGYTEATLPVLHLADVVETDATLEGERRLRTRAGELIEVELTETTLVYDHQPLRCLFVRDISDRVRIIVSEQQQRQLAEALANTAAALNASLDLDTVLDRILENLDAVVAHDTSSIMLVRGDRAYVVRSRGFAEHGLTYVDTYSADIITSFNLRRMIETREPIWFTDAWDYPEWRMNEASNVIRSYIGAPICLDDDVIGFLNVDGFMPGMYSELHARRLVAFANQAANAIRNARLFEEELRRRQIAEMLVQTANVLSSTLALPGVLELVLERMQQVVQFDTASCLEISGNTMIIAACRGFQEPDKIRGHRFPQAENDPNAPAWRIVQKKQPLAYDNIGASLPAFHRYKLSKETKQIKSWLGVPLISAGRVIGVITLDRFEVRPFTADEIELAQAVANQAAVSIENVRLFEQAQAHANLLELRVDQRTSELKVANEQLRQEIAERRRTEAALRASEERHRIISELTSDYVYSVIMNPDGSAESGWMGGAVERITGYTADEIRALPAGWNSLVRPADLEAFEGLFERLKNGETVVQEYAIITKNGQERWLRDYKQPIMEGGRVVLIWGAVQDVTELHRRAQELEQAYAELKVLSEVKDQFVSNVSHELRTPIQNLKLRQHLLVADPARMTFHLDVMTREIERLSHIIEDLLTLSRMDQKRMTLDLARVDLNALAQQYAHDRQPLAATRRITLEYVALPTVPPVLGDDRTLGQALSILLTNALHYTPGGGTVRLRVRTRQRGGRVWAGIAVEDNGLGIPEDEQNRLFERFFRGAAGRESGASGTGLGLSILKEIIDQHRGEVEVESTGVPGAGTTFTMWLPALANEVAPESQTRL